MIGKWMYNNTQDGVWGDKYYDSRKKAITAGQKEYPGKDFYVGQCEQIEIPVVADAEIIIDQISEVINDNYSIEFDFGESFYNEAIDYSDELEKSLEKVVSAWIDKHKFCKGTFVIRDTELIVCQRPW